MQSMDVDESSSSAEERCAICLGEFTDGDPASSQADAQSRGIVFNCGHGGSMHLSCLHKEAQQPRPFHCPLCRTKFGFSASCICGAWLDERRVCDLLGSYGGGGVCCDHCRIDVPYYRSVFHCPHGRCEAHPHGFDVCRVCAKRRSKSARLADDEDDAMMMLWDEFNTVAQTQTPVPSGGPAWRRDRFHSRGAYRRWSSRWSQQQVPHSQLPDGTFLRSVARSRSADEYRHGHHGRAGTRVLGRIFAADVRVEISVDLKTETERLVDELFRRPFHC